MAEVYLIIYDTISGNIDQKQMIDDSTQWQSISSLQSSITFPFTDSMATQLWNDDSSHYQIQNGQIVYILTDQKKLDNAKSAQKVILYQSYQSELVKSFTSSGMGTTYTYLADPSAKTRYNAIYSRFYGDPTYTSEEIYTIEGGYITHTKDQFSQVWIDGFNNEKALDTKYRDYVTRLGLIVLTDYTNVDGAISAVQAIVWS